MKRGILFFALTLACALAVASCDSEPTPTPAPPTPTPPLVNTLADVALRAGPGFVYDTVAQVPKQTALSLLGMALGRDCEDWVLVRTAAGEEGWTRPILVNVDIARSTLPTVPTPGPTSHATPMPETCGAGLALVKIDNALDKPMQVYLAGPEPGFTLAIGSGETRQVCLAPGEYCYDLSDGEKHERGDLGFDGGVCSCWHWGGEARPEFCDCSDDPDAYQRP
jgi:hypothetical protein